MTQLLPVLPILLVSAAILIFGARLLPQARSGREKARVTIDDFSQAREALDAMFLETAAVQQIFSKEDAEFIGRVGTPAIHKLFLRERRKLALRWIRTIQKQVAKLMDLHLRLAGYTYDTNPRFEFKLTMRYAEFLVLSNVVLALLWLFGPFNATRTVSFTIQIASNLCTVFSLRLDDINPTLLHPGQEFAAG